MKSHGNKALLGWLCIAAGGFVLAIAADLVPVPDEDIHAPVWVLVLCGAVFVVGGLMVFAGARSRLNSLFAAVLCGSFGAIGVWVTFFSPTESISGGLPFLAQETNATIGRWMFGLGSLISFAIAFVAIRMFLRSSEKK